MEIANCFIWPGNPFVSPPEINLYQRNMLGITNENSTVLQWLSLKLFSGAKERVLNRTFNGSTSPTTVNMWSNRSRLGREIPTDHGIPSFFWWIWLGLNIKRTGNDLLQSKCIQDIASHLHVQLLNACCRIWQSMWQLVYEVAGTAHVPCRLPPLSRALFLNSYRDACG